MTPMTAADAPATGLRSGYRGDIQGLRAIAILVVVAYHTGLPLPGGFTGVDIFFVISGFVITAALVRRLGAGSAALGSFYLGRIRRLLPALAVMLTVVLLASMVLGAIGAMGITARTGAAAALINANTYLMLFDVGGYFDATSALNPLVHTWSLSLEEQFYLVFPGLLALTWAGIHRAPTGSPMARAQRALLLILAMSLGLALWFALTLPDSAANTLWGRVNFYSAFTRAWEFAAGGLLAVTPRLAVRGRRNATIAASLGLLLIVVGLLTIHEGVVYPNLTALLPVLGAALLISAGTRETANPVSRALAIPPMVTVGNLSYSWYLWHWPIIVFVGIWFTGSGPALLVAAVGSLGAAWLSLRFIENPIRFRPSPRRRDTIRIGALCVAVPLIAALALGLWHAKLKVDNTLDPFSLHLDSLLDCDSPQSLADKPEACTWTVPDSRGRAVLVGDSLAGQYSEAFVSGMNAVSLDAQIATLSACPFIDLTGMVKEARAAGITQDRECREFVRGTMRDLLADPPEVLVMSGSAQRFLTGPETGAVFVEARTAMLQRLRDAGIRIALIQPLPKFPGWGPYVEGPFKEAPALLVLTDSALSPPVLPRAEAESALAAARSAESAAAAATGTLVLDFLGDVCDGEVCSARGASMWNYRDFEHLAVARSQSLSDDFARAGSTLMAGSP